MLDINRLSVTYRTDDGAIRALQDVSLHVKSRSLTVLMGETGSGKSTIARSIFKMLPRNAEISSESSIMVDGHSMLDVAMPALRNLRQTLLAIIPQNPLLATNPTMKCGRHLIEVIRLHIKLSNHERKQTAISWLEKVGLKDSSKIYQSYPHEISLGQLQRVCVAMALASKPQLIIADEPFSSLDDENAQVIVGLLRQFCQASNGAVLIITHDIARTRQIADAWYLLYQGKIISKGVDDFLDATTQHPYVRSLISSYRQMQHEHSSETKGARLLQIRNLSYRYEARSRYLLRAPGKGRHLLMNISLDFEQGNIYGIVGPSGSGKSTLSQLIGGLLDPPSGTIFVEGEDIQTLMTRGHRAFFKKVQYILQDSATALPPRRVVRKILRDTIQAFDTADPSAIDEMISQLLHEVRLAPSIGGKDRSQLSGGEKQRVCIARALAAQPMILIMDESLSALDKAVQYDILSLLKSLCHTKNLTIILVSHDRSLIGHVCDRVYDMEQGSIR